MDEKLNVLLNGEFVAELFSDGLGGGALRYTSGAIEKYGPLHSLLSTRLPVQAETYPSIATEPFLNGLLPENSVRDNLAIRARLSPSDTFGMLRTYGLECAGAVQFLAAETSETGSAENNFRIMSKRPEVSDGEVIWRTSKELIKDMADLPTAPLGTAVDQRVRVSLGGVQGKLLIVKDGQRIGQPVNGRPSTHILKPARLKEDGTELWPGIAQLETFALTLINRCQPKANDLKAAQAEVLTVGNRNAILVKRYDRKVDRYTGAITRLHQEDFCQALGTSIKYQYGPDTTPNLRQIAGILQEHAPRTLPELTKLLKLVTLNLAIGNCDMHARNISIMLADSGVSLAPAYDVVPTTVWDDVDQELSLRVGGEAFIEDINKDCLIDETVSWGLKSKAVSRTIIATLNALANAIPEVLAEAERDSWSHPLMNSACLGMMQRIKALMPSQ